jgi:hypothetical protein
MEFPHCAGQEPTCALQVVGGHLRLCGRWPPWDLGAEDKSDAAQRAERKAYRAGGEYSARRLAAPVVQA